MARPRNPVAEALTSKYKLNHRFKYDGVRGCERWPEQGIWPLGADIEITTKKTRHLVVEARTLKYINVSTESYV